jgi:hypothetical protein
MADNADNDIRAFLSEVGDKELQFTDAAMMMLQWYLSENKGEVTPRIERTSPNSFRWHYGEEYFDCTISHCART